MLLKSLVCGVLVVVGTDHEAAQNSEAEKKRMNKVFMITSSHDTIVRIGG